MRCTAPFAPFALGTVGLTVRARADYDAVHPTRLASPLHIAGAAAASRAQGTAAVGRAIAPDN